VQRAIRRPEGGRKRGPAGQPGDLVGLIGPNGAGKTTVFNVITGVYRPTSGEVRFDHHSIGGWPTHRITKLGIARTFQNIRLFRNLSVLENMRIARRVRMRSSIAAAVLRAPGFFREEREIEAHARRLLQVLELERYAEARATSLPYGSSAGWRSPARSPPSRSCCCWMSPPRE